MPTKWDELKAPFDAHTRQGRGGQSFSYIKANEVMDRLDAVVGPENWEDQYRVLDVAGVVECILRLEVDGKVVAKSGCGSGVGDEEPLKSGYSDALKRAAVKFGIGRDLYSGGDDSSDNPRSYQNDSNGAHPVGTWWMEGNDMKIHCERHGVSWAIDWNRDGRNGPPAVKCKRKNQDGSWCDYTVPKEQVNGVDPMMLLGQLKEEQGWSGEALSEALGAPASFKNLMAYFQNGGSVSGLAAKALRVHNTHQLAVASQEPDDLPFE